MSHLRSPRPIHAFVFLLYTVGLNATLHAQTPPRPAVDVRQMPAMWRQVTPADFNEDGRADLIAGEAGDSTSSFGRVVVRSGNGDGTFGAPIASGVTGMLVTIGDFNGDGHQDAVVVGEAGAMWILPGRGDGTFDAARTLDSVEDFRFARSGDVDGDGVLDLVLGFGTTVEVQPGGGDFTFGPTMTLPPGNDAGPSAAVIADLNGDGRPDIVVAQLLRSIFVYVNRGGLLFDAAEIVVAEDAEAADNIYDIATADLNGDGDLDLVVPHTRQFEESWQPGGVEVLIGAGDGTFFPPVQYHTGLYGPTTVAIGDFNRDSITDVAIGSRSFGWDDIGDYLTYCDSFSIFAGRGDGTLAPAASFRLTNFPVVPSHGFGAPYVDTHHALKAADINGDGHTDLVASPGAVIINRAATANRPPSVYAGPDRTVDRHHLTEISVTASDPDWDWLRVELRLANGELRGAQPAFDFFATEDQTVTVVVTDGRGGTATDSVFVDGDPDPRFIEVIDPRAGDVFMLSTGIGITWEAFNDHPLDHFRVSVSQDNFTTERILHPHVPAGEREFLWELVGPSGTWQARVDALDADGNLLASDISGTFTIAERAPGQLPWPWDAASIGFERDLGSATFDGSVFTVRGAGADVWGTADSFYTTWRLIEGDATFTARVASVEGPHAWTKVGIMIRTSLNDDAAHHFLLASVGKGLAYQRRLTNGGSSLHTGLGSGGAPVSYRIIRQGDRLTLQMMAAGASSFTTVASTTWPTGATYLALVTSSHVDGQLATGRFDGVEVMETGTLPAGWSRNDVGAVGAAGSSSEEGGRWTVRGSGADVWGTADEFHYTHRTITGDFDISARVASVENVNRWVKAGLMIRDGLSQGADHAFVFATPGTERGVVFQGRVTAGGATSSFGSPARIPPPVHLRLRRQGPMVHAYYRRATTDPWTLLAGVSYPNLSSTVEIGFAVSSHVDGRVATAVFDQLSIRPLPDWKSRDIGAVGIAGRTIESSSGVSMEASGADIWGTADAFRFRYAQGDDSHVVTARVVSVTRAHGWTKAGVMIRETLDPDSKHVMVIVSPGKGLAMQYRAETGGISANAGLLPGTAPEWLRLSREGDIFHGDVSNDGVTWTRLGSITVNMSPTVHTGLVLTSHNNVALATASFDNASVVIP
jgi:regulation of enolase protein 1 (concanavalin A-like superfamily)